MVTHNYNSDLDILTVDRDGREPEEYSHTVTVGDYNIDVDEERNFLGLELLNATENLPYEKEELEDVQDIYIEKTKRSGVTTLTIKLEYTEDEGVFSIGYQNTAEA